MSDRHFIWSGLSLVAERDGPSSQNIIKRYTPQGEIHSGGLKYYYTFDHLGNMRGAVNESGTLVAGYSYDPFGLPNHSGSMKFDILFTGHFYHEATGLYLAKYRAYDPKLGRWLSREPLGLDGPNPYHYGFNNPLNGVDKTGLEFGDYFDIGATQQYYSDVAVDSSYHPIVRSLAGVASIGIAISGISSFQDIGTAYGDINTSAWDRTKATGAARLTAMGMASVAWRGCGVLALPKYGYHHTSFTGAEAIGNGFPKVWKGTSRSWNVLFNFKQCINW